MYPDNLDWPCYDWQECAAPAERYEPGSTIRLTRAQFLALDPHFRTHVDAPLRQTRLVPDLTRPRGYVLLPAAVNVELV